MNRTSALARAALAAAFLLACLAAAACRSPEERAMRQMKAQVRMMKDMERSMEEMDREMQRSD
jgi:hypothetical protein